MKKLIIIVSVIACCVSLLFPIVSTTSHAQEVSDNTLTILDNELTVSDNTLTISDNELTVSGNTLIISDNEPTVSDNTLTISDNEPTVSDNSLVISDVESVNEENKLRDAATIFKEKTTVLTEETPSYIELNYTEITLYVKQTKTLEIEVTPSDYGLDGFKWKSSNTKIATVDQNGKVTAKAKGTAVITFSGNGIERTCKVTVKEMQLNKSSASVYVKKTLKLEVEGGSGTTKWKSSNTKVATVSSKGVVKGVKAGTTTITATRNGKKLTCKVKVKWQPEINETTKEYYTFYDDMYEYIDMDEYGKLSLTIENEDSENYLGMNLWDSDYSNVILSDAIAPGKKKTLSVNISKKGTYYLECYGTGSCTVKKTIKPIISESSIKMGRGTSKTLKALNVKNGGTWSSSNKSIATVTSKGVVKGKKNGTCYIKYTLKTGEVLKCKVKVVNPVTCSVVYVLEDSIYNTCGIRLTNYTNKKIKYIELNVKQYDNKGSRISSPFSGYIFNNDLPAKSSGIWEWRVNDLAKKCSASIKKVYFSDGSTWTP